MRINIMAASAVVLLALGGSPVWAQGLPLPMPYAIPQVMPSSNAADDAAVLASPIRTDEDRASDAARRTLDTLDFARVRPGWKVVDMIMGGGFFTRTLAAAVGPDGRVTAWQPAEFIAFQASYGEAATAADLIANVDVIRSPIGTPEFPAELDLVLTVQNYHDLHLRAFAADTAERVNAAVFAALKPGGYYVIIDHHALDGADASTPDTLHRIDTDRVVREVEAAGFVLAGGSAALWNDEDPRTASAFDASIRGRTSQFTISFRKPE